MLTKLSKPAGRPIREVKVYSPALPAQTPTIEEAWAARQEAIKKINEMRDAEYRRLSAEQKRYTGSAPFWHYERSAVMRQADANVQAFLREIGA